jgi:beta-phosphoglucomutase
MQAVVFDFDGVLVNSEPLHFRSLRECLLPEGIAIDEDEYLREYLAYDDREAIRIALERHGSAWDGERVDAVARRKATLFEVLLREVPFFPGARELATDLARDVPVGIASGALRGEIEAILAAGGIRDSFATVVGADDVARGKPHPDPYLAALAGLRRVSPGLQAGDCVAIEDSLPGIAAALAAGLRVVGVAHTYPARKLAGAHLVLDSIAQVASEDLRALCRS